MGNFYSGNMSFMAPEAPFFPSALPSDGLLDLVCIDGDIPRRKSIELLMAIPKGTFFDQKVVKCSKITAMRVIPRYGSQANKGCFSVDGEKYPFEPFQVEIHQALGTVLSKDPAIYQSPGPAGWEEFV